MKLDSLARAAVSLGGEDRDLPSSHMVHRKAGKSGKARKSVKSGEAPAAFPAAASSSESSRRAERRGGNGRGRVKREVECEPYGPVGRGASGDGDDEQRHDDGAESGGGANETAKGGSDGASLRRAMEELKELEDSVHNIKDLTEAQRARRRKIQNRIAAHRLRVRKKGRIAQLEVENSTYRDRIRELEAIIIAESREGQVTSLKQHIDDQAARITLLETSLGVGSRGGGAADTAPPATDLAADLAKARIRVTELEALVAHQALTIRKLEKDAKSAQL
ncbi:uncharacterized protein AMSG_09449 [Thecamonas trahens ATCC 50062]|uniref:BZIP domain-containing protein n=1 Tax=Thecamonas trahens ATCC 50062 TaxID=461836 RepID=A0A0L0DNZ1_THETB|nr:hypothetical protein AMSG_09449 [Thecamonas trahens ATCC 50062]KNC53736.1 hypothetical protein AMSG_09449 [Thecamonas trahens ATCC 50062]|eukprot:XP_013754299.1 hypothetical protein AMSG_09449 [Thecamonas trahens ATCC 50062]